MAHNSRAIRLYERMGFRVEGRRVECLLVDGQFVDELTMAAILPAGAAEPARRGQLTPTRAPRRGELGLS